MSKLSTELYHFSRCEYRHVYLLPSSGVNDKNQLQTSTHFDWAPKKVQLQKQKQVKLSS